MRLLYSGFGGALACSRPDTDLEELAEEWQSLCSQEAQLAQPL